jgi:cell wall-associated NlpC family hydrolase
MVTGSSREVEGRIAKISLANLICKTLIVLIGLTALVLTSQEIQAYPIHKIQDIIQTAKRQLGVRYRCGGDRPELGFDCSGFVSWVLAQNGIDLGRSSPEQLKNGTKIFSHELRPGDLVFFTSDRKRKRVAHVGIYLGGGEFIHAVGNNHRIQVNDLSEEYWARHYYGARRI